MELKGEYSGLSDGTVPRKHGRQLTTCVVGSLFVVLGLVVSVFGGVGKRNAHFAAPAELAELFVLSKVYDFDEFRDDFVVEQHPDQGYTNSCANYTDDGSTVFARDGSLVLRVASACADGTCLNSGRVSSKAAYSYGVFVFEASVPKCVELWPALWLLSADSQYGGWPCSGEIDVLESVDGTGFGMFNVVAGSGVDEEGAIACNMCPPLAGNRSGYRLQSTMTEMLMASRYFVEDVDCGDPGFRSWRPHTFVLDWQPDRLETFVDPTLVYDAEGRLVSITPLATGPSGIPSHKSWDRPETPSWLAAGDYFSECFPEATPSAPFDAPMNIVLNVAIGGYGGASCGWGSASCSAVEGCGGAIGAELVVHGLSVWERLR